MKKILSILLAILLTVPAFSQGKLRENFKESVYGIEISMIYVEGGEFMMGGTSEQGKEADKDEVIHRVTVGDFFIGQFEITQSQWEAVMETSVVQQSRKADAKLTLDGENSRSKLCSSRTRQTARRSSHSRFCALSAGKRLRLYASPYSVYFFSLR